MTVKDARPFEAVKAFIEKYSTPAIDPANVRRAGQRSDALPDVSDFVYFRPIDSVNIMRPATELPPDSTAETTTQRVQMRVQIDCYGVAGSDAFRRAMALQTAANTGDASDFLNENFGVELLYTTPVRDLSAVIDDDQYSQRFTFDLVASFCVTLERAVDTFEHATANLHEVATIGN